MVDQLPPDAVRLGHRLLAIRQDADPTVTCTFEIGGSVRDVVADWVVLALPFSTLRDCDLDGLSDCKLRAIRELGLGTNGKLHLGLRRRPWADHGLGGNVHVSLDSFQLAWDDSVAQPLPGGVMSTLTGGTASSRQWTGPAFGVAHPDDVSRFLTEIEPVFPGTAEAYTGVSYRDAWHLNPWSLGAYTCPRPGQYTTLVGSAGAVDGRVHFAGEHTSVEFMGFLNGALESGERAAKEVAAALA
jgi:monoamine oxidase